MAKRNGIAVLLAAAACAMTGCSSKPPAPTDLVPRLAASLLSQKWSHDELNHFQVVFHSDTLVQCGVSNDLWKLAEKTDRDGRAWTTMYELTEKGKKAVSAIDLKESGKGHEITLRGPYRVEVTGISEGPQPNTRRVGFRWAIDWDKAPEELKACMPRFELTGSGGALFERNGLDWSFVSYLSPEDAAAPQAALDKAK